MSNKNTDNKATGAGEAVTLADVAPSRMPWSTPTISTISAAVDTQGSKTYAPAGETPWGNAS